MIRIFRAALLAAAFGLFAVSSFAPAARAEFIYDLSVGGNWPGSGSIAFEALSGNSPVGVSAFAFHVDAVIGGPQDYGLADILSINWSIDGSSNLSLLLTTSPIPFGIGQSALLLTNQPGNHLEPCGVLGIASSGSISCEMNTASGNSATFQGILTARLVIVPEPTTITLFAAGLLGLGFVACRRRSA